MHRVFLGIASIGLCAAHLTCTLHAMEYYRSYSFARTTSCELGIYFGPDVVLDKCKKYLPA